MKEILNYKEWTYVYQCKECDCVYATDEIEARENFWKELTFTSVCPKCWGKNILNTND